MNFEKEAARPDLFFEGIFGFMPLQFPIFGETPLQFTY
jgi:hypothetical protein